MPLKLIFHYNLLNYCMLLFFVCIVSCQSSIAQEKIGTDKYADAKKIISDLDSIVTPAGLQQHYQVNIGNVKQWVFVRGQDKNNPIILFVHGGPASPLSPLVWAYQKPMEEYFTMVNYDQRGAGKTYNANDTTGLGNTIHIDRYVDDIIELTAYLKKKYNKRKVILMGHSWGTIIAMKAALKRPDMFYAYVGIGQVISTMENEQISFEYGLAQAQKYHNKLAIEQLESIAPYPGNKPLTRARIIIARTWPQYYGGLAAYRHDFNYLFNIPWLSSYYTPKDVSAINNGSLFTLSKILPEFLNTDFRPVKKFPIPVFMFMGRHDYTTSTLPVKNWLKEVKAPLKKGIWFENSAHLIMLEEPGKMLISLVNSVRPLALPRKKML